MNITNLEFTNITSFAISLNSATNDLFFPIILISIYVIVFILFNRYSVITAFLGASFITLILSIMLFFAGLISNSFFIGIIILFILSLLASYFFQEY